MKYSNNYLEVKNLTKRYKGSKINALNNISIDFTPGIYGILGANGAGKSTLFNILTGIIDKTEGSIYYKGKDIFKDIEKFKSNIGFSPQNQMMYPNYTVERFLYYIAALKGVLKKDIDKEVKRVLSVTELYDVRGKKISDLSGGMKQRLLISQALITNPQILILDEPTAGLDPKQRVNIRNFLSKISKNKIVLISTHVVSDIEHIAKEIVILKKGEFILKERPEEILKIYENNVIEGEVSPEYTEYFLQNYNVSKLQVKSNGKNYIKICGDFTENQIINNIHFKKGQVELEDVYLYLFKGDL